RGGLRLPAHRRPGFLIRQPATTRRRSPSRTASTFRAAVEERDPPTPTGNPKHGPGPGGALARPAGTGYNPSAFSRPVSGFPSMRRSSYEGHAMAEPGSVSRWLGDLQEGEHEAAARLWERYAHRLVALARARLSDLPRRAADEEDVALSAFASFCRAA